MKILFGIMSLLVALFISGCFEQTNEKGEQQELNGQNNENISNVAASYDIEDCLPVGSSMTYGSIDADPNEPPPFSISIYENVPKENYSYYGYNLSFKLVKFSNWQGVKLLYYVPNGTITHIYDSENKLIGGYKSEVCVDITYNFNDNRYDCRNDSEAKLFRILEGYNEEGG